MQRLSTIELHQHLVERYADAKEISVELIEAIEPAISLTLHDYGDMGVQIAAAGDQVFISTVLVPAEQVKDRHGLNDACMRLNPLNPLSNLGITQYDGHDTYIVFGELSSTSSVDQVDEEIRALAENTIDAAEFIKPFIS